MLILASTSDIIRVVTGQAGSIHCHASWANNAAGTITLGRTNTAAITTATTTTVAPAPSGSDVRTVPLLNVRNTHASVANDITIQHFDGATSIDLWKGTLAPGEQISWVDNIGWLYLGASGAIKASAAPTLFKVLSADDTGGSNSATAQPWFPTQGALSVDVGTYAFEGVLFTTRAAGTTAHTTGILFAGTATFTASWLGGGKEGQANDLQDLSVFFQTTNAEQVVKASSSTATENSILLWSGTVRVTAAGTLIPQFKYSAAPGGAPTVKLGSYFRAWKISTDAGAQQGGVWS